ncbi:MAG: oligopeptidase A [endosymbiont of Galathealinum brachiosum]|uniref:oligopeptidase A n=1 Tax=endosymbiont of Galathealinum brachiosum TaxID=2200906 RepID=A0A370DCQ7_9GAMM|nr:MAG: oligopeptidase A [endosymbiont of Galathealinum brachiosum]
MKNTILDITTLPKFTEIKTREIEPSISKIIEENEKEIKNYLKSEKNIEWNSFIKKLETLDNYLSRVWSPVSHLNSVMNTDDMRKAHDQCLPKLSAYSTEQSQNSDLYKAYNSIRESEEYNQLDNANKKVINNALLKFKLNGVALSEEQKKEFKEIKTNLSSLKSKFEQNVMDATQAFQIHIEDESQLSGLPDFVRDMAKQAAGEDDLKGWLFTLDAPSYIAVMTYSDIRKFREEIYIAFTTRASNKGPNAGEFDNTQVMEDILKGRKQLADILSFENYAEVSIADKMADKTDDVLVFLNNLVDKSKTQAFKEFEKLKKYAKKECSIITMEAWDVMYVSEKLKQKEYGISQEELKPYFPAPKVINGLFEIVKRLYGITIEEIKGVNVWHRDVKFYEIKDEAGEVRGQFYLDLYARNNKRGGAWMDECICRMKCGQTVQIPVAYLTCNLTSPVGDKPALLNHDEVTTLFHEFGHGLQHMLTTVNPLFVSGISGVEWDAVELPSQFMENWCWEKEGIELISGHVETGEVLPENLYKKLIKAKNFQSAMIMVRQLEFALFDFRLHMEFDTHKFESIQNLLNEVRQQVAVVIPPEINQFQHGFSHIFAGGYAAGYYSYKWAEVLSADAFSKFEENGIFDRKTGQEFLENILETGGSEKAMDLFVRFRGREPGIDALLRHSGLM